MDGQEAEQAPVRPPDQERPAASHLCIANRKDGKPCTTPHTAKSKYCIAHDPAITLEQRRMWRTKPRACTMKKINNDVRKAKSREDLLEILSNRLNLFMERFGGTTTPEIEETICQICRTYVCVLKAESDDGVGVAGWRMRKFG